MCPTYFPSEHVYRNRAISLPAAGVALSIFEWVHLSDYQINAGNFPHILHTQQFWSVHMRSHLRRSTRPNHKSTQWTAATRKHTRPKWLAEVCAGKPEPVTPVCLFRISVVVPVKHVVVRLGAEAGVAGRRDRLDEKEGETGGCHSSQRGVGAAEDDGMRLGVDVGQFYVHQQLSHILQTVDSTNISRH